MALQIDFWELLLALAGLIGAFAGVIWAFSKTLIRQFEKRLDERFAGIQADITKRAAEEEEFSKQLRQFEKEFLLFQRDMPLQYVRREDYIRGQSVIEAKLDAVYSKLELVQMKGGNA